MEQLAQSYLRNALSDPEAAFRQGQWKSIEPLLEGKRVLVVQRTGWGKSMVYFLATKLLRERGGGPTLLISPLLSLMRNQLEATQRIGITARTINSTNDEEWNHIADELGEDSVDVLLISPERLANDVFRQEVLGRLSIGLFVIDEAHCISDWGHDFRPDYRRIVRVLQAMPPNVPVLATTATANNRVVTDIKSQLGEDIEVQRGSLVRNSLKLQNIHMPSPSARLAWLAETIPTLPGSGIIYTLTKRHAEQVTQWLQVNHIDAHAYHADIADRNDSAAVKEKLEQQLLKNEIKTLVATVALGMGFDKPDLGFVIHYQRPASVVHYYQQVGRAGRAVDEAFGILLCGEEDDYIADFFIRKAFPPQQHINEILKVLDSADDGLSIPDMQKVLNLSQTQISNALNFLTVESPSPVIKEKRKWMVTATASDYYVDEQHVNKITQIRRAEQCQMHDYMEISECLMAFLQSALDDPTPADCGQCRNCNPEALFEETYDPELANRAAIFLRRSYQPIRPRKRWPAKNMFAHVSLGSFNIPDALQAEEGRALSLWRDAGWGQLVVDGKYNTLRFSAELVEACVAMLAKWMPHPPPLWVSCIPSLNHPNVVPDFANRLALAIGLPFVACIEKKHSHSQQKEMENSFQQAKNLDGVFEITNQCQNGPCLLVDDVVASGWTFTVASALLRQMGCIAVYPMALALNSPRMD